MVAVTAGTRERLTVDDSSSMKEDKNPPEFSGGFFSRFWDSAFAFGNGREPAGVGTTRREESDELFNSKDVWAPAVDAHR